MLAAPCSVMQQHSWFCFQAVMPFSFLFFLVISLTICSHLFRIAQAGWKGVRTVSEIRREKNIPVPFKKDSDYTKIERVQKVFNPLKIPANLLKELPYASHPKLPKKRKKPTKDDKKYVLLYLMFLLASLFVCVLSMCRLPERRFTLVCCCCLLSAVLLFERSLAVFVSFWHSSCVCRAFHANRSVSSLLISASLRSFLVDVWCLQEGGPREGREEENHSPATGRHHQEREGTQAETTVSFSHPHCAHFTCI